MTIENCQRFIECRQQGREYISPQACIEGLEAVLADSYAASEYLKAKVDVERAVGAALARQVNALEKALLHIQAACGMADPSEACRTVLQIVDDVRSTLAGGAV